MALETHIKELVDKHKKLEEQIQSENGAPRMGRSSRRGAEERKAPVERRNGTAPNARALSGPALKGAGVDVVLAGFAAGEGDF